MLRLEGSGHSVSVETIYHRHEPFFRALRPKIRQMLRSNIQLNGWVAVKRKYPMSTSVMMKAKTGCPVENSLWYMWSIIMLITV